MAKQREGNSKLRMPADLIGFGDWLADAQNENERKRGNRRGISNGHALLLLLASLGMTKPPANELDQKRMREIHDIATRRSVTAS